MSSDIRSEMKPRVRKGIVLMSAANGFPPKLPKFMDLGGIQQVFSNRENYKGERDQPSEKKRSRSREKVVMNTAAISQFEISKGESILLDQKHVDSYFERLEDDLDFIKNFKAQFDKGLNLIGFEPNQFTNL